MPTVPRHNFFITSSSETISPRKPQSLSSFQSDTAKQLRSRTDDIFDLSRPESPGLLPRTAQSEQGFPFEPSFHSFDRRQTYISNLPATYPGIGTGPGSGTIVGIVLGVVLGYLLLFWLIVSLIGGSRPTATYVEGDDTEIVVRRQRESSRRSRRSHRSRRETDVRETDVSEVSERPRRQASPPRRTERIIINETTRREVSRPPPASSARSPSERRENISINIRESERRVDGDDVVEVIEENSSVTTPDPKPRRKSGFRPVDPNAYAGGDFPTQEYSKSRSRRR